MAGKSLMQSQSGDMMKVSQTVQVSTNEQGVRTVEFVNCGMDLGRGAVATKSNKNSSLGGTMTRESAVPADVNVAKQIHLFDTKENAAMSNQKQPSDLFFQIAQKNSSSMAGLISSADLQNPIHRAN